MVLLQCSRVFKPSLPLQKSNAASISFTAIATWFIFLWSFSSVIFLVLLVPLAFQETWLAIFSPNLS